MTLDNPPQHDSDSMIPPQQHGPHSYVPFMNAPSSIGTFTLTSSSGRQPGSQHGAESASQGTTPRSSGEDLAPFSMAGLKDWELDLDALEVRLKGSTADLLVWGFVGFCQITDQVNSYCQTMVRVECCSGVLHGLGS